jgi:uncharacterized protein involved in exopolysaccharide biosynthesis
MSNEATLTNRDYPQVISGDEELEGDLVTLWHLAWSRRYFISIWAGLFGLMGLYIALTATLIFRAEAVVSAVHDTSMSGKSESMANQLGGLANLVGVNLTPGEDKGREAQAILQSRHLVELFIQRENLLPVLSENSGKPQTLWKAVKGFKDGVLTIREDKRTDLTTISMDWRDPVVAAQWVTKFIALGNEVIRDRALNDSTRNIEYLNKQIEKTNVVEIQRVMYNLIEQETKTLMLANARLEYAFSTVDPAVAPEIKIRPQRSLIVLAGIFLGALVGFGIVFVRQAINKARRNSPARA